MKFSKSKKLLGAALGIAVAATLANGALAFGASGEVVVTGRLRVAHGPMAAERMTMQAELETADGVIELTVDDADHRDLMALANRRVEVRGAQVADDAIDLASLVAVDAAPPAPAALRDPAAGPRPMRFAVVIMGTTDTSTVGLAQDFHFGTGAQSVKTAFEQVSGGQVAVSGRVFGPYPAGEAEGSCGLGTWVRAAEAAATRNGYVAANYDHVVVYGFNQGCGYAGIATLGGRGVFIPQGRIGYRGLVLHEVGHNLGAWHGGYSQCRSAFAPTCGVKEYGDPHDVMGAGFGNYYSAYHRRTFGWIPQSAVVTASGGTQTVDLIEQDASTTTAGTRMLEVTRPDGTSFVVERRTFSGITGRVWVRFACLNGSVCPKRGGTDTQFVDASPGTNDSGALFEGRTFTDPATNIQIQVLADPADGPSRVRVCSSGCPAPPRPPGVYVYKDKSTIVVEGTDGADVVRARAEKGIRLIDANGAAIVAGPGCVANGDTVSCRGGKLDLRAGAGDDRMTVSSRIPSRFDGGLGNDTFVGSRAADVFVGGAGTDTVDYRGRNTDKKMGGPVVYTIGGGKVSGQKGERDDIGADIERVLTP